jgi:hypothetical protein
MFFFSFEKISEILVMRLKSLKLSYEKGCNSRMTSLTTKRPSAFHRLKSTELRRGQIEVESGGVKRVSDVGGKK